MFRHVSKSGYVPGLECYILRDESIWLAALGAVALRCVRESWGFGKTHPHPPPTKKRRGVALY